CPLHSFCANSVSSRQTDPFKKASVMMNSRPIAKVTGTGRSAPAKVMKNTDFAAIGIETSDEWIVERTGIRERHISEAGDSTKSMAANAARAAMQKAGVQPGEIDTIILSTATPDRLL